MIPINDPRECEITDVWMIFWAFQNVGKRRPKRCGVIPPEGSIPGDLLFNNDCERFFRRERGERREERGERREERGERREERGERREERGERREERGERREER